MKLEGLQTTAVNRTKAVVGAWTDVPTGQTKKMLEVWKDGYIEIEGLLKEQYLKLTGIDPKDAGYLNELTKYGRLENLQKQIEKSYKATARKAGLAQIEMSRTSLSNIYYQDMYAINWFSGTQGMSFFTVLNPKIVQVSVLGTPEIWQSINKQNQSKFSPYLPKYGTLADRLNENAREDLDRIEQTITSGLRRGLPFEKVSSDLQDVFNTTATNAMRIARTEGMRNMNSGAYANSQAAIEAGVDIGREVIEIEDSTTRKQSSAINGQKRKGLDPFNYPTPGTGTGGLKVDIIGNSGVAEFDINERGTSVDFLQDMDPNTIEGINPATGKHGTANMRDFDLWMDQNDLRFSSTGRITSKGKTAF